MLYCCHTVQVSYYSASFKSDYRCLLVLPCPRRCASIAYEMYCACLLLLCGDVETNPGPDIEKMLQELLVGQTKLVEDVAALRTQQNNMEKIFADWGRRFTELEKRAARVDDLERTVKSLESKIVDLEDRSRRSNLLIFGLQEEAGETETELKQKVVTDIFSEKLNVNCSSIGRIHRLGKPGKQRPVIIFFQNFNEKRDVLKNAYKLKGTSFSVQNDYSRETLRKRKLLWDSAKAEKKEGKKVALIDEKLRVDNDYFIWSDPTNSRVKIHNYRSTSKKD